jgi:hypothetical protein
MFYYPTGRSRQPSLWALIQFLPDPLAAVLVILLIVGGAHSLSMRALAANLVVNGSFEGETYLDSRTGNILPSGWTLNPQDPAEFSKVNVDSAIDASIQLGPQDGSKYLRFQSTASNGSRDCFYQYINTVAGQQYRVSFWVAMTSTIVGNRSGLDPVWDEEGLNPVHMGTDQFYFEPTNTGPVPYQLFSFTETASENLTVIEFHGANANGSILLDNVVVEPVVTNQMPVAGADIIHRWPTNGATVSVASLLSNDSDPDGDPLTLLSVSPNSANGGTVTLSNGWITYTPPNTDTFTYTISDGHNPSVTGTVTVALQLDPLPQPKLVVNYLLGSYRLGFDGVPNRTCDIEYTQDLGTAAWQWLGRGTTDLSGRFEFIDTPAQGSAQRFYRAFYP